jgi:exosome complex RNA-binding protein Csl4
MTSCGEIACFPGQRICAANENTIAGTGTYERSGYIHSSLAGIVVTEEKENVRILSLQHARE